MSKLLMRMFALPVGCVAELPEGLCEADPLLHQQGPHHPLILLLLLMLHLLFVNPPLLVHYQQRHLLGQGQLADYKIVKQWRGQRKGKQTEWRAKE